ncbi:nitroreductase/quinone reductase family protein [Paractinoplanes hotanensis]|uniref:Nitroreductase family deazaflavin-dependent oxidoreductase n=1 Tax=Paractinoplanes hotanensis TaxID=2906497 RepID=A0ABT0Y8B6_9ACTN|nr:nitroreductase/quinone reductase family protein [Actinoplanes hotanensis]MCM4082296.1 nitroreductase family deazaflavin-dependent oxidoreductase [Actinoplanes hotanensis]
MASFNDRIIATFRANKSVAGGPWQGKTLILLHHTGRRSGRQYVTPALAAPDGTTYVICGTLGGAPHDPQWVANLEAATGPATIALAGATVTADYEVVLPADPRRPRQYGIWRDNRPKAREYERMTDRQFPVVRLRLRSSL